MTMYASIPDLKTKEILEPLPVDSYSRRDTHVLSSFNNTLRVAPGELQYNKVMGLVESAFKKIFETSLNDIRKKRENIFWLRPFTCAVSHKPSFHLIRAFHELKMTPTISPQDLAGRLRRAEIISRDLLPLPCGYALIRVLFKEGSTQKVVELFAFDPTNLDRPLSYKEVQALECNWEQTLDMLSHQSRWEISNWRTSTEGAPVCFLPGSAQIYFNSQEDLMGLVDRLLPKATAEEKAQVVQANWKAADSLEANIEEISPRHNLLAIRICDMARFVTFWLSELKQEKNPDELLRTFTRILREPTYADLRAVVRNQWMCNNRKIIDIEHLCVQSSKKIGHEEMEEVQYLANTIEVALKEARPHMAREHGGEPFFSLQIPWEWSSVILGSRRVKSNKPSNEKERQLVARLYRQAVDFSLARRAMIPTKEESTQINQVGGLVEVVKKVFDPMSVAASKHIDLMDPYNLVVLSESGYAPLIEDEGLMRLLNIDSAYTQAQVLKNTEGLPYLEVSLNTKGEWELYLEDSSADDGKLRFFLFDGLYPVEDKKVYEALLTGNRLKKVSEEEQTLLAQAIAQKGRVRTSLTHVLVNINSFLEFTEALGFRAESVDQDFIRRSFSMDPARSLENIVPYIIFYDAMQLVLANRLEDALKKLVSGASVHPNLGKSFNRERDALVKATEFIGFCHHIISEADTMDTTQHEAKLRDLQKRLDQKIKEENDVLIERW
ncbi:MAG: hypothetical protein WCH62_08100 [Candidatus Omnitrophota bacterium]